jgi:hypothetical protein
MNGPTEEQDNEMTLAAFEGYCYQCEQQGHKADACLNRKFYFQLCVKQGHIEQNGWLKEESKNKRPQGYKMPDKLANLAVQLILGSTGVELVLIQKFPKEVMRMADHHSFETFLASSPSFHG